MDFVLVLFAYDDVDNDFIKDFQYLPTGPVKGRKVHPPLQPPFEIMTQHAPSLSRCIA